jgi:hypothetical protein
MRNKIKLKSYCGWIANEDFGFSETIFGIGDLVSIQDLCDAILGISLTMGPCFLACHLVSANKVKFASYGLFF